MSYFMGKEGFVWWQGVVEDRHDPLYLGRCKVRILGWNTEEIGHILFHLLLLLVKRGWEQPHWVL